MAAAVTTDPLRKAALDAQEAELKRVKALSDQALQLELIEALVIHLGSPPALQKYLDEVNRRAAPAAPAGPKAAA